MHAQIQKVLSEGVQLKIPLKADHHWPVRETPFEWLFAGVTMMAQH